MIECIQHANAGADDKEALQTTNNARRKLWSIRDKQHEWPRAFSRESQETRHGRFNGERLESAIFDGRSAFKRDLHDSARARLFVAVVVVIFEMLHGFTRRTPRRVLYNLTH